MFFEDSDSFVEKMVANKSNPMMYFALLLSILCSFFLHHRMKLSEKKLKNYYGSTNSFI